MANAAAQGQRHVAHTGNVTGGYLRSSLPPGRLTAPAIIEVTGRHRKNGPERRPAPKDFSGSTPAAIPPHPPLVSGGWYRSLVRREVLGPGRYPLEAPVDRSVGAAVALSAVIGPLGICYSSVTVGMIAIGVTAVALVLFGIVALLVVWPVAIAVAGLSARWRHRRFEQQ